MKENERTLTEEDAPHDPIFFKIPSRKVVMREFKLNLKWLLRTIAAYIIFTLVSAIFALGFENHWTFMRAFYFTVLSTLTGGYGDLTLTTAGKILLCINSFAGLVLLGLILAVVAMSLQAEEGPANAEFKPSGAGNPSTGREKANNPELAKIKAAEGIVALIDFMKNNDTNEKIKSGDLDVTVNNKHYYKEIPGRCEFHFVLRLTNH